MKKFLPILLDAVITVAFTLLLKLGFELKDGTCLKDFCVSFANEHSFSYGWVSGVFIWVIVFILYRCLIKKRLVYMDFIKTLDREKSNINTDDLIGSKVFSYFNECLNKTIDNIVQGADYQLIHSNDNHPVDLAYEFSILNGKEDSTGNYCVDKGTLYRIRRSRVLGFNSKFIHRWNVLYATEFNLPKFIADTCRWNDDEEYRRQLKNWHKSEQCHRYVFLTKNEIETIMANPDSLNRLTNYLAWHFANGWFVFMYITETEISSLQELGFVNDTKFDGFVDLLIVLPSRFISRNRGTRGKVFVQDKHQNYKIICDKAKVKSYKTWFEKLPKDDHDRKAFPVMINFNSSSEGKNLKKTLSKFEIKTSDDETRYQSKQKVVNQLKKFIQSEINYAGNKDSQTKWLEWGEVND